MNVHHAAARSLPRIESFGAPERVEIVLLDRGIVLRPYETREVWLELIAALLYERSMHYDEVSKQLHDSRVQRRNSIRTRLIRLQKVICSEG